MAKVKAGKKGKPVVVKKNFKAKAKVNLVRTQGGQKLKSSLASRLGTAGAKESKTLMQRTGKLLQVTQPINDLRQLIKTKGTTQPATKKNNGPSASASNKESIKNRLGLQSASAKNRAKLVSQVVQANVESNSGGLQQSQAPRSKNRTWKSNQVGQQQLQQQQQQPQSILLRQAPPVVMITAPNLPGANTINSAPQQIGYSVIVSNLNPSVTPAEISELFGEIGPVQSIQPINSSTSMVTYANAAHASQAIAEYNNRFLDGQPMQVTLIPAPNPVGNVIRKAFREAFAH